MGTFCNIVLSKKGARISPLRRDFSRENWDERWRSLRDDGQDDRLHASGLWIWERWCALHAQRLEIEAYFPAGFPFGRRVLGWVNVFLRQNTPSIEGVEEITPTTFQRSDASSQTNEAIVSLLGDAVALILQHYGHPPSTMATDWDAPYEWEAVSRLGAIHVQLVQLIAIWEECLKLGYWIEESRGVSYVRTEDDQLLRSCEIASDRRSSLTISSHLLLHHHADEFWESQDPPLATVASVTFDNGDVNFTMGAERGGPLSAAYVSRKIAIGDFPQKLLQASLPKYDLTVLDLLLAHECLLNIADVFLDGRFTFCAATTTLTAAQLPSIPSTALSSLIERSCQWRPEKVRSAIEALTYRDGARDGGWSRPLIMSEGHALVVLPLLTSNPSRLVEHWLIEGGHGERERGRIYEDEARGKLKRAIDGNPMLSGKACLAPSSVDIEINGALADIDIVLRIGSTVFLGEFKGKTWPITPWEMAHYRETLQEASGQIARRITALAESERNLRIIAEATGYSGDPAGLTFVGAVVMYHQEGFGCDVLGYPVVDLGSLCDYFREAVYQMGYVVHAGASAPTVNFKLYESPDQAGTNLRTFLRNQPRWLAREPLLIKNGVRGRDPMPSRTADVVHDRWDMAPYGSREAMLACKQAEARWASCLLGAV